MDEALKILRKAIDEIDAIMDKAPNRELADFSNSLEEIYQNHNQKKES